MFGSYYTDYSYSSPYSTFTPMSFGAFGGTGYYQWLATHHSYSSDVSSTTSSSSIPSYTSYKWSETPTKDFFKTKSSLEKFLAENCSNSLGIVRTARLTQKQTQIMENEDVVTPYVMLNDETYSNEKFSKKNNNTIGKLTRIEYADSIVRFTGLLAPYFYLLNNSNKIYFATHKKFFNATLDLLAKFTLKEDGYTKIGRLLNINLHLPAFKVNSVLSNEFYDLMLAFSKLSNKEICAHYQFYKFVIKKELEFINLDRFLYWKRLIETSKNDKLIIQAQNQDIILTISNDITTQIGLKPGCRISCIYGLGFFLGIEKETGLLWFLMDHNTEPNCWQDIKTKEDLAKHLIFELGKTSVNANEPTLAPATKLVQSLLDVIQTNSISIIKAKFLKKSAYSHASFSISSQSLNKYNASFLDEISTEFGIGTIIGECDNKLWFYLHNDNNCNNFYSLTMSQVLNCKIAKRSEIPYKTLEEYHNRLQEHDNRIISSESFNILSSSIQSILQKNHNLIKVSDNFLFINILNIFLDLHLYLRRKYKKNPKDKIFQKKLAIFHAILNFFYNCKDYDKDLFMSLLNQNLKLYKIPKGIISKEFFKIMNTLKSFKKEELISQYQKYINILEDAETFLDLTKNPKIINTIKLNQLIIMTRDDTMNEIDTSSDTLNKFGVNFYQQIMYKNDQATIIGLNNARLCYYFNSNQQCFVLQTLNFEEPIKYNLDNNSKSDSNLQELQDGMIRNNVPKPKKPIEFITSKDAFLNHPPAQNNPLKLFAKMKDKKKKNDEEGLELEQRHKYK